MFFNGADRWISLVEEQKKQLAEAEKERIFFTAYKKKANEHIQNLLITVETLQKKERHFSILAQLGYDYLSFLELFEDEETKAKAVQVGNILQRMEKHYEFPAQEERTESDEG